MLRRENTFTITPENECSEQSSKLHHHPSNIQQQLSANGNNTNTSLRATRSKSAKTSSGGIYYHLNDAELLQIRTEELLKSGEKNINRSSSATANRSHRRPPPGDNVTGDPEQCTNNDGPKSVRDIVDKFNSADFENHTKDNNSIHPEFTYFSSFKRVDAGDNVTNNNHTCYQTMIKHRHDYDQSGSVAGHSAFHPEGFHSTSDMESSGIFSETNDVQHTEEDGMKEDRRGEMQEDELAMEAGGESSDDEEEDQHHHYFGVRCGSLGGGLRKTSGSREVVGACGGRFSRQPTITGLPPRRPSATDTALSNMIIRQPSSSVNCTPVSSPEKHSKSKRSSLTSSSSNSDKLQQHQQIMRCSSGTTANLRNKFNYVKSKVFADFKEPIILRKKSNLRPEERESPVTAQKSQTTLTSASSRTKRKSTQSNDELFVAAEQRRCSSSLSNRKDSKPGEQRIVLHGPSPKQMNLGSSKSVTSELNRAEGKHESSNGNSSSSNPRRSHSILGDVYPSPKFKMEAQFDGRNLSETQKPGGINTPEIIFEHVSTGDSSTRVYAKFLKEGQTLPRSKPGDSNKFSSQQANNSSVKNTTNQSCTGKALVPPPPPLRVSSKLGPSSNTRQGSGTWSANASGRRSVSRSSSSRSNASSVSSNASHHRMSSRVRLSGIKPRAQCDIPEKSISTSSHVGSSSQMNSSASPPPILLNANNQPDLVQSSLIVKKRVKRAPRTSGGTNSCGASGNGTELKRSKWQLDMMKKQKQYCCKLIDVLALIVQVQNEEISEKSSRIGKLSDKLTVLNLEFTKNDDHLNEMLRSTEKRMSVCQSELEINFQQQKDAIQNEYYEKVRNIRHECEDLNRKVREQCKAEMEACANIHSCHVVEIQNSHEEHIEGLRCQHISEMDNLSQEYEKSLAVKERGIESKIDVIKRKCKDQIDVIQTKYEITQKQLEATLLSKDDHENLSSFSNIHKKDFDLDTSIPEGNIPCGLSNSLPNTARGQDHNDKSIPCSDDRGSSNVSVTTSVKAQGSGNKKLIESFDAEVKSLKAVLELKSSEIHNLRGEKQGLEVKLEEYEMNKDLLMKALTQVEGLKAQLNAKSVAERKMSVENRELSSCVERIQHEQKRLSMENEELSWRIRLASPRPPLKAKRDIQVEILTPQNRFNLRHDKETSTDIEFSSEDDDVTLKQSGMMTPSDDDFIRHSSNTNESSFDMSRNSTASSVDDEEQQSGGVNMKLDRDSIISCCSVASSNCDESDEPTSNYFSSTFSDSDVTTIPAVTATHMTSVSRRAENATMNENVTTSNASKTFESVSTRKHGVVGPTISEDSKVTECVEEKNTSTTPIASPRFSTRSFARYSEDKQIINGLLHHHFPSPSSSPTTTTTTNFNSTTSPSSFSNSPKYFTFSSDASTPVVINSMKVLDVHQRSNINNVTLNHSPNLNSSSVRPPQHRHIVANPDDIFRDVKRC